MPWTIDPDDLEDLRNDLIERLGPSSSLENLAQSLSGLNEIVKSIKFDTESFDCGEDAALQKSIDKHQSENESKYGNIHGDVENAIDEIRASLHDEFITALTLARRWDLEDEIPWGSWYDVIKASQKNVDRYQDYGRASSTPLLSNASLMASYWETVIARFSPEELPASAWPVAGHLWGDWGYVWNKLTQSSSPKLEWLNFLAERGLTDEVLDDDTPILSPMNLLRHQNDYRSNDAMVRHSLELTRRRGLDCPSDHPLHQWAQNQPERYLAPMDCPWQVWLDRLKALDVGKRQPLMDTIKKELEHQFEAQPKVWTAWLGEGYAGPRIEPSYGNYSYFLPELRKRNIPLTCDLLIQAAEGYELKDFQLGYLLAKRRLVMLDSVETASAPKRSRYRS